MRLRALALGLIMVVALPFAATASPMEAEVIKGPTDALFQIEDWSVVTEEEWQVLIDDSLEIFNDTQPSTNCATYAAVTTTYIMNVSGTLTDQSRLSAEIAYLLYHELDAQNYLCARE